MFDFCDSTLRSLKFSVPWPHNISPTVVYNHYSDARVSSLASVHTLEVSKLFVVTSDFPWSSQIGSSGLFGTFNFKSMRSCKHASTHFAKCELRVIVWDPYLGNLSRFDIQCCPLFSSSRQSRLNTYWHYLEHFNSEDSRRYCQYNSWPQDESRRRNSVSAFAYVFFSPVTSKQHNLVMIAFQYEAIFSCILYSTSNIRHTYTDERSVHCQCRTNTLLRSYFCSFVFENAVQN